MRLDGAIELAGAEAETADQGAQRAVLGVEGNHGPLHLGHLRQQVADRLAITLAGFGGGRIATQPHDIAGCQQLGHGARRRAAPVLVEVAGRPANMVQAEPNPAAIVEQQLGMLVVTAQHQRRPQVGHTRDFRQPTRQLGIAFAAGQRPLPLRAAPAMAAVIVEQSLHQTTLGGGLVARANAGVNLETVVQGILAITLHHRLPDHFGDVGRFDLDRRLVPACGDRLGLRSACGIGIDVAFLQHPVDDVVAAQQGALRIDQGIAAGGKLGDRRQGCRLGQTELRQRLAEVVFGRRRDAVGAIAEETLVQVQREDFVLAQFALHLDRQEDLGELADVGVFRAQEELAGDLLGDRAAAGHTAVAGGGQQPDGPRDAAPVEAGVLVEAGILGRQHRQAHGIRHLGHGHRVAARFAEQGDQFALAAVHGHRQLQFDRAQALDVGQTRCDQPPGDQQRQHTDHSEGETGPEGPLEQTAGQTHGLTGLWAWAQAYPRLIRD